MKRLNLQNSNFLNNHIRFAVLIVIAMLVTACAFFENADPDSVAVSQVIEELAITYADGDSTSGVRNNLGLKTDSSVEGVNITWESANPVIITADGTVVRPEAGSTDKEVKLTATVSMGLISEKKVFTVTVLAIPLDEIVDPKGPILTTASVGETSVELAWESMGPGYFLGEEDYIVYYIIYYDEADKYENIETFGETYASAMRLVVEMFYAASHIATISDLKTGAIYYFTMKSVTVGGYRSDRGNVIQAIPTAGAIPNAAPGLVQNIQLTPGDGQITVSWEKPADTGMINGDGTPGIITKYTIYYKKSEYGTIMILEDSEIIHMEITPDADDNLALTATLKDLENYERYPVTVTASNAFAEGRGRKNSSAESNNVSARPVPNNRVPGAPASVKASPGDGAIQVSWNSPADLGIINNGNTGTITGYKIYYTQQESQLDNPSLLSPLDAAATAKSARIDTLSNDTPYFIAVAALNNYGQSILSNRITATPKATAIIDTSPGAPTNISLSSKNHDNITVSWDALDDTGMVNGSKATLTGYTVYYSTKQNITPESAQGSVNATADENSVNVHIDELNPSLEYYYIVTASNKHGESPASTRSNPIRVYASDSWLVESVVKDLQEVHTEASLATNRSSLRLAAIYYSSNSRNVYVTWTASPQDCITFTPLRNGDLGGYDFTLMDYVHQDTDVEVTLTAEIDINAAHESISWTFTMPKKATDLATLSDEVFKIYPEPATVDVSLPLKWSSIDLLTIFTSGTLNLDPGYDFDWSIYNANGDRVDTSNMKALFIIDNDTQRILYLTSSFRAEHAGTYTIRATGKNNYYSGYKEVDFVISVN